MKFSDRVKVLLNSVSRKKYTTVNKHVLSFNESFELSKVKKVEVVMKDEDAFELEENIDYNILENNKLELVIADINYEDIQLISLSKGNGQKIACVDVLDSNKVYYKKE